MINATGMASRTLTEKQQMSIQQLGGVVENIRRGVENFFRGIVNSLPDASKIEEILDNLTSSNSKSQSGQLLVSLLSILDQNPITRDAYDELIPKMEKIINGSKLEYFTAQKNRMQYFENSENKIFRTERASVKSGVKPASVETVASSRREEPSVDSSVLRSVSTDNRIGNNMVSPNPIGNKAAEMASKPTSTTSIASQAVPSSGTRIKAFNKTLELKTTITDGNCGPDSLQKALSSASHATVPSSVQEMRVDVANRCENVRAFILAADSLIEILDMNEKTSSDKESHYSLAFNHLRDAFINFNALKSVISISDNKTLKEMIKNVNSWDVLSEKLKNYEKSSLILILKGIQQFFSVNFTNEDTGVFGGMSRSGVNHSNYHSTIAKSGVYLDIQEMKVGLLAYGFSVVNYKVVDNNTIFKAKNDQNQEMYLYLTRYAYGISKKIESNSHWQYLTAGR